jgi:hypothetical protein
MRLYSVVNEFGGKQEVFWFGRRRAACLTVPLLTPVGSSTLFRHWESWFLPRESHAVRRSQKEGAMLQTSWASRTNHTGSCMHYLGRRWYLLLSTLGYCQYCFSWHSPLPSLLAWPSVQAIDTMQRYAMQSCDAPYATNIALPLQLGPVLQRAVPHHK